MTRPPPSSPLFPSPTLSRSLWSCPLPCSPRAPLRRPPTMEVSALPAGLFDENNVCDFHPFIEGFTHVVDREGRCGNRDQPFHFPALLSVLGHCAFHFYAILEHPPGHTNIRKCQRIPNNHPFPV